jgi:hypothetical protein
MANEVFISYSRKDLERVRKIKNEIDQAVGIDCWMDLDGIDSDKQFVKVIINAIKLHDTMLFMLTFLLSGILLAWCRHTNKQQYVYIQNQPSLL